MKSLREVGQVVGCDAPLLGLRSIGQCLEPALLGPLAPPGVSSLRNVLERGSVAKYTFSLDQFRITNTLSFHEDTDYVSFTLKVGDTVYGPQTKAMGDLNNGTYPVGLSFGPIPIDGPDTRVAFNYTIVNSGHSDAETVLHKLGELGKKWSDELPAPWDSIAYATSWLVSLFTTDCDGVVVNDEIIVTESKLKSWTCNTTSYAEPERHYGRDSLGGICNGSGSDYYVTWSIRRGF